MKLKKSYFQVTEVLASDDSDSSDDSDDSDDKTARLNRLVKETFKKLDVNGDGVLNLEADVAPMVPDIR